MGKIKFVIIEVNKPSAEAIKRLNKAAYSLIIKNDKLSKPA